MKIQKKIMTSIIITILVVVSVFTIKTQAANETNNQKSNASQSRYE